MSKTLFAAALALTGAAVLATDAAANPGPGPFCATGDCGNQSAWGKLFHKQPVPAFQAAPWYLYWPYNAHFQTPAPLTGAYYAPPAGGAMVNPYFPAAAGGYPTGYPTPAPAGAYPVPATSGAYPAPATSGAYPLPATMPGAVRTTP